MGRICACAQESRAGLSSGSASGLSCSLRVQALIDAVWGDQGSASY